MFLLAVTFYNGVNHPVNPDAGLASGKMEILSGNGGYCMDIPAKETMAKYLQLQYWNKLLYDSGTISRKEYLMMAEKIRQRYSIAKN